jgi:hypothetical protein
VDRADEPRNLGSPQPASISTARTVHPIAHHRLAESENPLRLDEPVVLAVTPLLREPIIAYTNPSTARTHG